MTSRVVLANGAGWGNFGDDAIVRSIGSAVVENDPGTHLVNFGGPAGEEAIAGLARRNSHYAGVVGWQSRAKAAAAIARSRLLIIGGGGLLQDELPFFYRQFTRSAQIARLSGVPYAIVGVGVYRPTTEAFRKELKTVADGAAHVSVRDEASAAALRDVGVRRDIAVVPDPAFAYPFPAPQKGGAPARPRIGVALRPWWHLPELWERPDPDRLSRFLDEVASAIVGLALLTPAECRLIPMHVGTPDDDVVVAKLLGQRLELAGIPTTISTSASAAGVINELGGCSVVLGMRLHSLILAASQGVPTVALNYDDKVSKAMTLLGRQTHTFPLEGFERDMLTTSLYQSATNGVTAGEASVVDDLRRRAKAELVSVAQLS